jgi:hypothetical protein
MTRILRGAVLCLAAGALVSATEIPFDGVSVTPGTPIEIATASFAATYASEGVTFDSSFYIDNQDTFGVGLINAPSAPNYGRIAGAENTPDTISFSVPVHTVAIDTLTTNGGNFDGAVFTVLSGSNVLYTYTIQPTTTTTLTVPVMFSSEDNITAITFSKFHNPGGTQGAFGFDNLFISAAVPEPSTVLLVGFGVVAAGLLRRRVRV